jgi:hypothetical protein
LQAYISDENRLIYLYVSSHVTFALFFFLIMSCLLYKYFFLFMIFSCICLRTLFFSPSSFFFLLLFFKFYLLLISYCLKPVISIPTKLSRNHYLNKNEWACLFSRSLTLSLSCSLARFFSILIVDFFSLFLYPVPTCRYIENINLTNCFRVEISSVQIEDWKKKNEMTTMQMLNGKMNSDFKCKEN